MRTTTRPRVLHVISGLEMGGAEMVLLGLVQSTSDRIHHIVISLRDEGDVGAMLSKHGAEIYCLELDGVLGVPHAVRSLVARIRSVRPVAVHCWMHHANLIGGLAARIARVNNVIWSVHNSRMDGRVDGRQIGWVMRAGGLLSRVVPHVIVYCSESSRRYHEKELSFFRARSHVVYNGFETEAVARRVCRNKVVAGLALPEESFLVLHVGAFRPMKDHATLLKAAIRVVERNPKVHFLLCGRGVERSNPRFEKLFREVGVPERVHPLGIVASVRRLQAAAELVVLSSSHGEAFPMVVGESMGVGTPCIVTDVGDSSQMVGLTGFVVQPRNPEGLADQILAFAALDPDARRMLGDRAKQRIAERYSASATNDAYVGLYLGSDGQAIGEQRGRGEPSPGFPVTRGEKIKD